MQTELQSHLKQAAFQLPLDQEKNHLFSQGLAEVYAPNQAYLTQRNTRQMHQSVIRSLATKSPAPYKQTQGNQQQHQKAEEAGKGVGEVLKEVSLLLSSTRGLPSKGG